MKEKLIKLGALATIAAMGLGVIFGVCPTLSASANEVAQDDGIVYEQDFSDASATFAGLTVTDGVARPAPGGDGNAVWEYRFADGEAVESNNYELSFDVRMDATTSNTYFFVHFLELAGGSGHTYMSIEQNGAWVCNCTTLGGSATTGTGTPTNYLHGSIIEQSPTIVSEEYLHVKYIHYNGILEVWIDDVRYIVQSLKNIGNNAWGERKTITENPIDGFLFHFMNVSVDDPSYYLDNIVLKEIKDVEDVSYTETVAAEESVSKVFGNEIATTKLGRDSYAITAEYTVKNTLESAETVKMELCGLNGLTGAQANGDNYTVTFSAKLENGSIVPSLGWYDSGVKDYKGTAIDFTGDKITMKAEISGTKLICSINGTIVIEGEFVKNFGMYKGDFQTLSLVNSNNIVWTSVKYEEGKAVISEVAVTADKRVAESGEAVTFTATYKPENITPATIEWKVNGTKVDGANALTYVMTQTAAGTYKVSCIIDGVESANSFVIVKEAEDQPSTNSSDNGNEGGDNNSAEEGGCGSVIGLTSVALVTLVAATVLATKKRND